MIFFERFRLWRARRRVLRDLRECEVNILTALDQLNFAQHMLRTYERKHAELSAELAHLQSPADVRRSCPEPI